jgi:hypothetical protein
MKLIYILNLNLALKTNFSYSNPIKLTSAFNNSNIEINNFLLNNNLMMIIKKKKLIRYKIKIKDN